MNIKSDTGISTVEEEREEIKPTLIQETMLSTNASEVLWYGSRAGGKSYATYFAPLYHIEHKDFTGLILRTSFTDLNDYLKSAKTFYEPVGAKITFGGNPKIVFPSGATLFVSYMKDNASLEKQKGKNLQLIIFEELTQLPSEELYEKLLATLRSSNPDIKPQMIATTNPDGPGAKWVYDRWDIGDESKSNIMWETEEGVSRHAIKSGVLDNPYILDNNPEYVTHLKSYEKSNPTLYKQWYLGEFTFTADKSQYYHQWMIDAEKEDRIKDFYIEPSIPVYTAHDIGINDHWSIVFWQHFGNEVRIINYYENNNEGVEHYISILHDFRDKYRINYGMHFGPHDIEVRELSTGISRKQTFGKMGLHMSITPRESVQEGINSVRQLLPKCYFHKTNCISLHDNKTSLIQHLKVYRKQFNEATQNFSNQPFHGPESNGADAFRYFALNARDRAKDEQMTNGQMNVSFM